MATLPTLSVNHGRPIRRPALVARMATPSANQRYSVERCPGTSSPPDPARQDDYADCQGGRSHFKQLLQLAELVPLPSAAPAHSAFHAGGNAHARRRPARHARRPDGLRRRRKRRAPGPLDVRQTFLGQCELADADWKDHGCWAIDTSNSNSWKSAENSVLHKAAADVLLLQESKLSGPDAPSRIASRGKTFGWACDASSAHRTAFDKASGGCTVGVRRVYGLAPHSRVKDGFAHRVHFAWSAIVAKGGLHLGSIWLRDSEGLSADNLLILQETAAIIKQIRGPWVLGGD